MMKKLIALLAVLCIALGCLAGCQSDTTEQTGTTTVPVTGDVTEGTGDAAAAEWVDYAAEAKLDMSSNTAKQKVTVKTYVDGDTTHFNVPSTIAAGGTLKARYLAVNTPESTGQIQEWGKKASGFTRSRLESAEEIYIESEDGNWNVDSTGSRYLLWIWYRPSGTTEFRNLNVELLQEGLSVASSYGGTRYGEICEKAIQQAKNNKLHMHSGEKDPDFYYGAAVPLTLKELRTNIEFYNNMKVAFEGVVSYNNAQTAYVEEYDSETDTYYGMSVYYGYNLNGAGLEVLTPGNRVKIVGSVQYYETGGTWQVADIEYSVMRPDDPDNIALISSGHEPANRLTSGDKFKNGKMDIEVPVEMGSEETTVKTFDYGNLILSTSISMENLKIEKISTTTNEDSSMKGAMTFTCRTTDGMIVSVRTVVLYDSNNVVITKDKYEGRTINVKGIVDFYTHTGYQLKVFTADDITIVG